LQTLASDVGVGAIGAASSIPLGGPVPNITASKQDGSVISTAYNHVSPAYFGILGIPIIRGRNFTSGDATSRLPVAIVSAASAKHLFPATNALGQTIRMPGNPARDVR